MSDALKEVSMSESDEKVCLCKYVSKDTVEKSIHEGADDVDKVGRATGAGRGACNGARCKHKIHEMIKEHAK